MHGVELDAGLGDEDVLRLYELVNGVVAGYVERNQIGFYPARADILVAGEARGVGDEGFYEKCAVVGEVRGDAAEAVHLRLLRGRLKERVEDDICQCELLAAFYAEVGEVADGNGDGVAAGLGAHPGDDGFGGVYAVNLDAALR